MKSLLQRAMAALAIYATACGGGGSSTPAAVASPGTPATSVVVTPAAAATKAAATPSSTPQAAAIPASATVAATAVSKAGNVSVLTAPVTWFVAAMGGQAQFFPDGRFESLYGSGNGSGTYVLNGLNFTMTSHTNNDPQREISWVAKGTVAADGNSMAGTIETFAVNGTLTNSVRFAGTAGPR